MDNNIQNVAESEAPKAETEAKNPFVETMKAGMDKAFGGMKTATVAIMALMAIAVAGCKSLPSVEKMESTAKLIGTSAGMVVNMTKIDAQSKAVVIEVMNIAEKCVPQADQTFLEAWMPIAKEHVAKLVSEGKIDEAQGSLILVGFELACKGLDYVFEVRYPKAREYKELVEAAIHGFITGFTSVVNVETVKSPVEVPPYDKDAFEALKSSLR